MRTLARRVIDLTVRSTDDSSRNGASWEQRMTGEERLRAQSALSSIECSVFMGQDDDAAVRTAVLLLRGVNKMRWADRVPAV